MWRLYFSSQFQLDDWMKLDRNITNDFSAVFVLLFIYLLQVLCPPPKSALIIMDTTRHIISEALYQLMVMLLTLGQGVQSMPVPTDVPMCMASEPAQYRLTFTGKWSQAAFPKQYPVYRPPAQWSNIVGKSTASRCLTVFSLVIYWR